VNAGGDVSQSISDMACCRNSDSASNDPRPHSLSPGNSFKTLSTTFGFRGELESVDVRKVGKVRPVGLTDSSQRSLWNQHKTSGCSRLEHRSSLLYVLEGAGLMEDEVK
jgi:hypothetical protein